MGNIGIYKIVNKVTNESYVGSSINLKKRKSDHFYLLKRGNHGNTHLQNSYKKYGHENFDFFIIEICETYECLDIEQKYINQMKPEFNINPTAGNSLGVKHKKETIEKIRNSQKGKIKSEETKRKISEKNKGIYRRKKMSELSDDEIKTYRNKEGFVKKRKIVLQFSLDNELIKEWESLQEIKRNLNFHPSHISKCCNKKRKTAYGYEWRFKQ
jgi:group I intron endonuclease